MVPFRESLRLSSAPHFRGRFILPGDKSVCHRLAILGALAEGETRVGNFSTSADCRSTLDCLTRLGVPINREGRSVSIAGQGWTALQAPPAPLDAGNSGSTLRMLAGVLASRPFESVLLGDPSLMRRPMERLAAPLRAMGARVLTQDGRPPVIIRGGSLKAVDWTLTIPSAQVKTALLLAGLQAEGTTTIEEPQASRDHTERLLPFFGAMPTVSGLTVSIHRHDRLEPVSLEAPGDISSAAFLIVAALILPDSFVRVDGVLLNPHRTAFLGVLRAMGADIETGTDASLPEPVGWIEARSSKLHGGSVPPGLVPSVIDEIPALAVAGAHAEGVFSVEGASELRVKESDRLAALREGLSRLGADVEERPDGLVIRGGRRLRGTTVRSHGDHRIAMALATAALAASDETDIEGAECASVSFPEYFDLLKAGTEASGA